MADGGEPRGDVLVVDGERTPLHIGVQVDTFDTCYYVRYYCTRFFLLLLCCGIFWLGHDYIVKGSYESIKDPTSALQYDVNHYLGSAKMFFGACLCVWSATVFLKCLEEVCMSHKIMRGVFLFGVLSLIGVFVFAFLFLVPIGSCRAKWAMTHRAAVDESFDQALSRAPFTHCVTRWIEVVLPKILGTIFCFFGVFCYFFLVPLLRFRNVDMHPEELNKYSWSLSVGFFLLAFIVFNGASVFKQIANSMTYNVSNYVMGLFGARVPPEVTRRELIVETADL